MRLRARLTARLFPTKPELLGRLDYSIVQAFGIVTRKEELYGREKSGNITILLVADILTNTLVRGHSATLQFDYRKSNTIDINDQIGAAVA